MFLSLSQSSYCVVWEKNEKSWKYQIGKSFFCLKHREEGCHSCTRHVVLLLFCHRGLINILGWMKSLLYPQAIDKLSIAKNWELWQKSKELNLECVSV